MNQMNRLTIAVMVSAAFATFSCSDETSCASDSECFSGESCTQGRCVVPSEEDAGSDMDQRVVDSGSADMGDDAQMPAADAGEDAGEPPGEDSGRSSCIVDPFEVDACPDDDNDRFAERFVDPTIGCQNDGYVGLDETRTERFCSQEEADLYSVTIIECEERSQVLEVRLTPLVSCIPDLINIEASVQGLKCSEQEASPDVECGWQEDGSYLAQFVVAAGRSITSSRIEIDTDPRSDIDFDYDLQVKLR